MGVKRASANQALPDGRNIERLFPAPSLYEEEDKFQLALFQSLCLQPPKTTSQLADIYSSPIQEILDSSHHGDPENTQSRRI
jgi:hypothetical protein